MMSVSWDPGSAGVAHAHRTKQSRRGKTVLRMTIDISRNRVRTEKELNFFEMAQDGYAFEGRREFRQF
jgi:hypothetical protein